MVLEWTVYSLCDSLQELAAEGYRRMSSTSGEGLGLMLWALSQYGWTSDSKRFWNTVFRCVRLRQQQQQVMRVAHGKGPWIRATSAKRACGALTMKSALHDIIRLEHSLGAVSAASQDSCSWLRTLSSCLGSIGLALTSSHMHCTLPHQQHCARALPTAPSSQPLHSPCPACILNHANLPLAPTATPSSIHSETGAKWDTCSARSAVLLYVAVADMAPPDVVRRLRSEAYVAFA